MTADALIHGARIHYQLSGAGPAVAFLHAGIADLRMWDEQARDLAASYRVLRHDMRGFGRSAPVAGSFSHRDDLGALLDHLAIDRVALVGASMGGRIAVEFALAHPDRVAALVLAASTPAGFDRSAFPPPAQDEEIAAAAASGDLDRCSALEAEVWLAGPGRRLADLDPGLVARVVAMNRIALAGEALGLGDERSPEPAFERLGEIRCPTLIAIGRLDQPHVIAAGHATAARIDGARVQVFESAHLPAMECPAEFNRALRDFLAVALAGAGG